MIKYNKPKAKQNLATQPQKEKKYANQKKMIMGFLSSVKYCFPATVVVQCLDCSLLFDHQKVFQH